MGVACGLKVSASAGVLSEGLGESSASKFTHVAAGGIVFFLRCWTKAQVLGSWVLARSCPQFLAIRASPTWPLNQSQQGRESASMTSLMMEGTPSQCWLEASYWRGRGYTAS